MIWKRLLGIFANTLDRREREVVLGDIAEAGLNDRQACAGIFGLMLRRQLQPWRQGRAWLALIGVTLPVGLLLSRIANDLSAGNSVLLWMYASNWTPRYLSTGWFWSELMPEAAGIGFSWIVLSCWAWAAGLVIASISRISTWINAALITLVLCAAVLVRLSGAVDVFVPPLTMHSAAPLAKVFYGITLPAILLTFLVLLPAIAGLRHGRHADGFSSRRKLGMRVGVGLTALSLLSNPLAWWFFLLIAPASVHIPRLQALMPLALAAPAAYFLASRIASSRRTGAISKAEPTSTLP